MNEFLDLRIGKIGNGFFIFLSLLTFIIIRFNPKFKFNINSDDKEELTENNEITDEELSLSERSRFSAGRTRTNYRADKSNI